MDNMTLSAKERHQLLSVLREMDSAAPREKRQTPRRSVVLRVRIRVISALGKTTAHWALLRDVSARGIGLTLPFALSKGARLVAPLKFREGGGWLVLCEVRNCEEWEVGQFTVGARFIDKIDDPDGSAKPPLDWLL